MQQSAVLLARMNRSLGLPLTEAQHGKCAASDPKVRRAVRLLLVALQKYDLIVFAKEEASITAASPAADSTLKKDCFAHKISFCT